MSGGPPDIAYRSPCGGPGSSWRWNGSSCWSQSHRVRTPTALYVAGRRLDWPGHPVYARVDRAASAVEYPLPLWWAGLCLACGDSSHWQLDLPSPVSGVPTASSVAGLRAERTGHPLPGRPGAAWSRPSTLCPLVGRAAARRRDCAVVALGKSIKGIHAPGGDATTTSRAVPPPVSISESSSLSSPRAGPKSSSSSAARPLPPAGVVAMPRFEVWPVGFRHRAGGSSPLLPDQKFQSHHIRPRTPWRLSELPLLRHRAWCIAF